MNASLIPPGQGNKFWLVGDQLCFKITGERTNNAFAAAENYITPKAGPPPHVHHREHECFYVLSGTFLFACGDTALVGKPGTAVFLPKDVPHVFKNIGDTPGKFLLLAIPAGFESMTLAAGQAIKHIPFDKAVGHDDIEKLLATIPQYGVELQPNWTPAEPAPAPNRDRKLWVIGNLVTIKLTAADTDNTLSLAEVMSWPGGGVPAHSHRDVDEVFYVLDGHWEFTLDGRTFDAAPGTFIHVPKGVTHSFTNTDPVPARLVDFHLPGGFERFFEELGLPADDESSPPPVHPPEMDKLLPIFNKHGMDVPL